MDLVAIGYFMISVAITMLLAISLFCGVKGDSKRAVLSLGLALVFITIALII